MGRRTSVADQLLDILHRQEPPRAQLAIHQHALDALVGEVDLSHHPAAGRRCAHLRTIFDADKSWTALRPGCHNSALHASAAIATQRIINARRSAACTGVRRTGRSPCAGLLTALKYHSILWSVYEIFTAD